MSVQNTQEAMKLIVKQSSFCGQCRNVAREFLKCFILIFSAHKQKLHVFEVCRKVAIILRRVYNHVFCIYVRQILVVSRCKESVELTSRRATRFKSLVKIKVSLLDFSLVRVVMSMQKDVTGCSSALRAS